MSKDITIQKVGVDQELDDVPEITTPQHNGGSCGWVPEDERQLTEKTVTENGEYAAADDGYYGYNRIIATVGLQLPYTGTTPNGVNYTVYLDSDERPHLTVNGSEST